MRMISTVSPRTRKVPRVKSTGICINDRISEKVFNSVIHPISLFVDGVHEQRKYDPIVTKNNSNYIFNHYACCERELRYKKIIKSIYKEENKFKSLKFLEIGAGGGDNLFTFKRMGLNWNQIYANELIPDRYELLKKDFPNIKKAFRLPAVDRRKIQTEIRL